MKNILILLLSILSFSSFAYKPDAVIDHGALLGLSDDDHPAYPLLLGRATGQKIFGGTASGDDLTLESTSDATKGTIIISGRVDQIDLGNSVFFGTNAGSADDGTNNNQTGYGHLSLELSTNGTNSSAFGYRTLSRQTALAFSNSAFGQDAGLRITNGDNNTLLAALAGSQITTGLSNLAVGVSSGNSNQTGGGNIDIGMGAGTGPSGSHDDNICIGTDSCGNVTTGSDNLVIAHNVDLPTPTTNNYMNIGGIITGDLSSGKITIGTLNLSGIPTHADEAAAVTAGLASGDVYKTSTGELRIKL